MAKQFSDDGSKRVTKDDAKFKRSKKNAATGTRTSIDCFKKRQCCVALKRLMVHRDGWPFKKPQGKSRAYGIGPNKPLITDFDTVMWKLEKDMYMETRRFADDVRTVFDNAVLLYSPRHQVHRIALKLSELFETKWKCLEERWRAEEEEEEGEERKQSSDIIGGSYYGLQGRTEKEQVQLQRKRKRERERLEKMERTVFLDENFMSYQDFKHLCGYTLSHS